MLLAPWLPPNTKTIGKSGFNPNSTTFFLLSSDVKLRFLVFDGVPVTIAFTFGLNFAFASLNPNIMHFAFLDINFVAIPGNTLLS